MWHVQTDRCINIWNPLTPAQNVFNKIKENFLWLYSNIYFIIIEKLLQFIQSSLRIVQNIKANCRACRATDHDVPKRNRMSPLFTFLLLQRHEIFVESFYIGFKFRSRAFHSFKVLYTFIIFHMVFNKNKKQYS